MAIGIVGIKRGMTRVFTEDGVSIPVTVVEADPNRITQLKTADVDGYEAVQVTTGSRKANRISKAEAGHYKKAHVEAGRGLWEFRVDSLEGFEIGGEVKVEVFEEGQKVDVTYSYDENSVMHASFVDVATGNKTETELSNITPSTEESSKIDDFIVD